MGIVPSRGEQTAAEKRFSDINPLNWDRLVKRLQMLANILPQ